MRTRLASTSTTATTGNTVRGDAVDGVDVVTCTFLLHTHPPTPLHAGFGCQAAGFLTVFASHLSVYTLCVITLERWYAITNAMHLNKRIGMRTACVIMLGGWSYAGLVSALPLLGVSNYSSTSICLPMEARDSWDVAYLVVIIANSGLAFVFIAVCYGQIYMSLGEATRQAHRHASRTEMTVAKKMALLVRSIGFVCRKSWADEFTNHYSTNSL